VIADKAAKMTGRKFLNRRWGMPGSFQRQDAGSSGRVCFVRALVNYC
jgi:hypothetical protein